MHGGSHRYYWKFKENTGKICVMVCVAMAATLYLPVSFELLHHLPYSAHLAASDFHVFQCLEDSLCGHTFESDENVIYAQKMSSLNSWMKSSMWTVLKHLNIAVKNVLHLM